MHLVTQMRSCYLHGALFQRLEDKIVTFMKNKLKKIQKFPSPDNPELESQRADEKELDGVGAEQCETLLKVILHFLRKVKQEELADNLQRSNVIFINVSKDAPNEMPQS